MDLVSVRFYIFCVAGLIVYFIIPAGKQWTALLVSSLMFYFLCAKAGTFLYVLISVFSVYAGTVCMELKKKWKKQILAGTAALNLGLLAVLQYSGLFYVTAYYISGLFGHPVVFTGHSWAVSLGISFYTLQILSYCLDCYWGVVEAERNFFKLLLFTCYFPQMISGPISRYGQIAPQLFGGGINMNIKEFLMD